MRSILHLPYQPVEHRNQCRQYEEYQQNRRQRSDRERFNDLLDGGVAEQRSYDHGHEYHDGAGGQHGMDAPAIGGNERVPHISSGLSCLAFLARDHYAVIVRLSHQYTLHVEQREVLDRSA